MNKINLCAFYTSQNKLKTQNFATISRVKSTGQNQYFKIVITRKFFDKYFLITYYTVKSTFTHFGASREYKIEK